MKRPHVHLLVLFALPALCASIASAQIDRLPLDGYAATVDGNVITIGDVVFSIHEADERLRILHGGTELAAKRAELFRSGLEQLIEQEMIVAAFTKKGAAIPERMIDERVNQIIFDRFKNDRAALLAALADDGMTLEEWRTTIRDRMIVSAMRRMEIGDKAIISPRALIAAYEEQRERFEQPSQVDLRLIYLKHGDDPEAAYTRLSAAREQLLNDGDFATVARELSEDPSAPAGGDWGWIEPGMLRAELRDAIAATEAGAISEIIATPEGLYLLRVAGRRDAVSRPFEDVRDEIEETLRRDEIEQLYQEWIQRLRNQHAVVYHIDLSDSP
jgi:peptidyl-prolyl cis-trans isomerase SurA